MIMSVEEFRQYADTDVTDVVLEAKLCAIELLIRKYTNNNFQDRRFRTIGNVYGKDLTVITSPFFEVGDTVMVDSDLCMVCKIEKDQLIMGDPHDFITLDRWLAPSDRCLVTKVVYPMDVKVGAANMLKWDIENRDKVGIQSETISRHSVTYFDMGADNSALGFPKSLTGFLKPYMKARF